MNIKRRYRGYTIETHPAGFARVYAPNGDPIGFWPSAEAEPVINGWLNAV